MQQPLTVEQSLAMIDEGLGGLVANRGTHVQLQQALMTVRALVDEHSPKPEPDTAAKAEDAKKEKAKS